MAGRPPTGTVTFLFTDIEGSTQLLQQLGASYEPAIATHRRLLRACFERNGGYEMGTEGDSFFVAFARASDALAAAVEGQIALLDEDWGERPIRVRMGMHTGEADFVDDDYYGLAVHQAARISSAAHGGQVLVSQTTRDLTQGDPPDGVSLVDIGEHRLKDLADPVRLYNVVHGRLQAEFPPPRTLSVLPNNLPLQLTTFVGRDEEIAKIHKLLESTRLLTLCGAGGTGKTRLALQVAADLITEHRDGVWFADLSPLTEGELIVRGIAEALGVREEAGRSIEDVLIGHLQGRDVLVVVDNCEHMAEASAATIDRLLHAATGLRVVATSREPLGSEGETVFRVPTLEVPGAEETVEALSGYESVRLFCDRAGQATGDFSLDESNGRAIAEICARLDGMPLAIELAAARVRMLTPEEIAKRLDDRFKLLTGGLRSGIRRQQTLRAAVDWSYDMLIDDERSLFRRLSVFVGGFTLDAVEAVCSSDDLDEATVFDLLCNLVDRSLVVAEPREGSTRYRLLETMREYGREMLASSGEASSMWDRHLGWFADLADGAFEELYGSDQGVWLERIDAELDNVRQALTWSTSGGNVVDGRRIVGALMKYWEHRALIVEGARWSRATADGLDEARPEVVARGWMAEAFLTWNAGDTAHAGEVYDKLIALPREPALLRYIAEGLNDRGIMAWGFESDLPKGVALLEEGLDLRRRVGFTQGIRESLNNLAQAAKFVNDLPRAQSLIEEALQLARQIGAPGEVAFQLDVMAGVYEDLCQHARAAEMRAEALEINRSMGMAYGEAETLTNMGAALYRTGDYNEATRYLEQAVELVTRQQDLGLAAYMPKRWLALIDLERGRYEAARATFEETLAAFTENPSFYIAYTYDDLSRLHWIDGDIQLAIERADQALTVLRSAGDKLNTPYCLARRAMLASAAGDTEQAVRLADEAATIAEGAGLDRPHGSVLFARGVVAATEGRVEDAVTDLRESVDVRARGGYWGDIPRTFDHLADLATSSEPRRAAVLLGCASRLREERGMMPPPFERDVIDRATSAARDALVDEFDVLFETGRSSERDAIVDIALGRADP